MKVIALVILLAGCAHGVYAQVPLDGFKRRQIEALASCQDDFRTGTIWVRAGSKTYSAILDGLKDCIRTGRADVQAQYKALAASMRTTREKEALTNVQVAFVTAMEAIPPGSDEREAAYSTRQRAMRDKLSEAWARLEVER